MSLWAVGRSTEGSSSHIFFLVASTSCCKMLHCFTYFSCLPIPPLWNPTLREFYLSTVEACIADTCREGVGNANSIPTLPPSLLHFIPAMQALQLNNAKLSSHVVSNAVTVFLILIQSTIKFFHAFFGFCMLVIQQKTLNV